MIDSRNAVVVLFGVSVSACASTERVNIGDDVTPGVVGESLSDYAGAWKGYAEAHEFNDGTDAVRITLNSQGDGTIKLGAVDSLPAPDPAQGPPGGYDGPVEDATKVDLFYAGFAYPVHQAQVEDRRIRLVAQSSDIYGEWCGLQEPRRVHKKVSGDSDDTAEYELSTPPRYNCLGWEPASIVNSMPVVKGSVCGVANQPDTFDCDRTVCLDLCQCDETACEAIASGNDARLDAALQANQQELVGTLEIKSLNFGGRTRMNVRLVRQAK